MWDDIVAGRRGSPGAAIPSPQELDRGIDVIAANGARAPDFHDRYQLFRRTVAAVAIGNNGRSDNVTLSDGAAPRRS